MDPNLVLPALTDCTLLGSVKDDRATFNSQPINHTAECTEFIVSPGASVLLQELAFRPYPASISITAVTHTIGRPPVPRPESQRDWDTKKETIRRLYLDENLPLRDIIDIMSKVHSFSAT
ncbi:n1-acetylpolyamine oxidase [Colletotrichum incanum]|nr:n1-acetylpolyamine oxidase [Colletotrichum incanum]